VIEAKSTGDMIFTFSVGLSFCDDNSILSGVLEKADCTITMFDDDLLALMNGTLNPHKVSGAM